jgi:hypothetical protein
MNWVYYQRGGFNVKERNQVEVEKDFSYVLEGSKTQKEARFPVPLLNCSTEKDFS